jgi:chromosome segregation ATPase
MVLLDQERQEAEAAESRMSGNLEKVTQKLQSQRDTIIALETRVTELTRQNEKLDSELAARVENNTALQASLEEQKAATTSIEQEFSAYKQQHALGGELGALQDAVAGLQAQLTNRNEKKNKAGSKKASEINMLKGGGYRSYAIKSPFQKVRPGSWLILHESRPGSKFGRSGSSNEGAS